MARWVAKAILQGSLSLLPNPENWNYLFQRYVTKSVIPTKRSLVRRLEFCATHLASFQELHHKLPRSVLELGTGWVPTVPVGLYLCGVDDIYSIDIHDLRKPFILGKMLETFYAFSLDELRQALPQLQEDRWRAFLATKGGTPQQVFEQLGIHFLIADARHMEFADHTIDLFVSNTTLEHIPAEVISGIFKEFYRVAKQDALMSHLIDISDHYSHFDSSITPYHYMQHNALTWRLVNNALIYQNRLRVSDYRELHRQAGFTIIQENNQAPHVDKLQSIKLAKGFEHYSTEDLMPTSSWMISRPVS
jgi:hypothetical protein